MPNRAEDAGVWGTRTNTPDSLQNIKHGSRRARTRRALRTFSTGRHRVCTSAWPSPFFETPLWSLLTWHRIDTVVITGGSTSGCVRARRWIDSLSRGYRSIVPEQCVADKHESYALRQPGRHHAQVRRRGAVADTLGWLDRTLAGLAAMSAQV
jgi:hypothetical protein